MWPMTSSPGDESPAPSVSLVSTGAKVPEGNINRDVNQNTFFRGPPVAPLTAAALLGVTSTTNQHHRGPLRESLTQMSIYDSPIFQPRHTPKFRVPSPPSDLSMQSQSFVEPSPVAVAFDMDSCPSSMDSAVASPKSNHRQPAGTPTVAPNKVRPLKSPIPPLTTPC